MLRRFGMFMSGEKKERYIEKRKERKRQRKERKKKKKLSTIHKLNKGKMPQAKKDKKEVELASRNPYLSREEKKRRAGFAMDTDRDVDMMTGRSTGDFGTKVDYESNRNVEQQYDNEIGRRSPGQQRVTYAVGGVLITEDAK